MINYSIEKMWCVMYKKMHKYIKNHTYCYKNQAHRTKGMCKMYVDGKQAKKEKLQKGRLKHDCYW